MKKTISCLLIIISFFLFMNSINADEKKISKECMYTDTGFQYEDYYLLEIYEDNTSALKSHSLAGDGSDQVLGTYYISNWDKEDSNWNKDIADWVGVGYVDKEGNDAKGYYIKTGECPDYLYTYIGWFDIYYYLSNFAKEELDSRAEKFDQLKLVTDDKTYDPNDLINCEYEPFILKFSKSTGIFASIISKYSSVDSTFSYRPSKALAEDYSFLDKNICPVIQVCNKTTGMQYAGGQYIYELYSDSQSADKDKCSNPTPEVCIGGDACDPNYKGVCPTYDKLYEAVSTNYKFYKLNNNVSNLNTAHKKLDELKSLCRDITDFVDYGDVCLDKCLNLNKQLNEDEINISSTGECGFSDILFAWIKNIISIIKYIIPVIVIIFGIVDFIKAIASDKDDEMKKAQGRFIKRLIAAALVFIVPFIIEFILDKAGFINDECAVDLLGKIGL